MPVNRVLYNLEYPTLQDKEAHLWITGFELSLLSCLCKTAAECQVIKTYVQLSTYAYLRLEGALIDSTMYSISRLYT